MQPNFYVTESGYRALVNGGEWQINDVPLSLAKQIKDHFDVSSSFALFASGLAPEALAEYRGKSVAGMDWVRAEDKPKPGELPLNVYRYLMGSPGKNGYPVFACGHSGVLPPSGWCTLPDLEVYFSSGIKP